MPSTLDWDKLMKTGSTPKSSIDFFFHSNTLTFDFKIELEYIGQSVSRTSLSPLGVNYIIDFVSFKTYDSINKPNHCGNKLSSSYLNREWSEWWEYSTSPWIHGHIATDKYLAYSTPTKYWRMSYWAVIMIKNIIKNIYY